MSTFQPFLVASLILAGPGSAWLVAAEEPSPPPGWREIDGRKEPQRLPQYVVWEGAMRSLVRTASDGVDGGYSDESIAALSRYTLYISPSEVRRALDVARSAINRVDELRKPLNEEHGSGKSLGWTRDRRLKTLEAAEREVMRGKLELQSQLSPQAFRAVERWAVILSFGTVLWVRE